MERREILSVHMHSKINDKAKKQMTKRQRSEANARRKVAKDWDRAAHGIRYIKAAIKDLCQRST